MVYEPGGRLQAGGQILRLFTDTGPVGECLAGRGSELSTIPQFWHYLKGKSVLHREKIYDDIKRALRQSARIGVAPIDNALWDIAGKLFDVPIHRLLGGHKGVGAVLRQHLPRRSGRQPRQPAAVRRLRRPVPGDGLSGVQDPRLEQGAGGAGGGQRACRARGGRRRHGPDARPRLRTAHLRRCRQGGARLRRGRVLLVRGSVPRRRHFAVRPPQAAPVDPHAAAADRTRALA